MATEKCSSLICCDPNLLCSLILRLSPKRGKQISYQVATHTFELQRATKSSPSPPLFGGPMRSCSLVRVMNGLSPLLCHHASTKEKEKKKKGSFDFSLIPKGEGGEPRTAKGKRMNGLLCARLLLLQSGGERRESVGKVFWTPQGDGRRLCSQHCRQGHSISHRT